MLTRSGFSCILLLRSGSETSSTAIAEGGSMKRTNKSSLAVMAHHAEQLTGADLRMMTIPRIQVPAGNRGRWRKAFVTTLPFWQTFLQKLQAGIGRSEAIEIDLQILQHGNKQVTPVNLAAQIRHQMHKNETLRKRYSIMTSSDKMKLFVIDNESGALLDAAS
jgi:hypothetical protein